MSPPTIFQVIKSVLAAAVGIQSNENRERDFAQGSVTTYIVVGVIFVVIFIFVISTIVSNVLSN